MKTSLIVVSFVLLAGCGQGGTLNFESGIEKSALTGGNSTWGSLVLGEGQLIVDTARISVSEIEFEGGGEDELEVELGAADIDLPLDGELTTVASDSVDAGLYHTLGLELRGGQGGIRVQGSYNGVPFVFESGLRPELEFALAPAVDVPANGQASVGVTFDVAAWFGSADGVVLDPGAAENQSAIEANILASMAAHAAIETEDDGAEDDD